MPESISLNDIQFDEAGRVIITNAEVISKLRKSAEAFDSQAIKNIGCCSAPADLTNVIREAVQPGVLERISSQAIKNIGCCAAPADIGIRSIQP